jgi:dipeptidyl aminopeptidase/acylaminoacyl peptidase
MPLLSSRPLRWAVLALALFVNCTVLLRAQDAGTVPSPSEARIDEILSGINRARTITQVAVSPDGKRLAWVQDGIFVAPIGNIAASRRISAASASDQRCAESELAWSPDSSALVFASDCAQPGEQLDLYLSHLDGKPPVRLTKLQGDVDAPAFSPDGEDIAFLYVEGATRPAGALAAMNAPSGVIGEDGIEVQRVAIVTVPPNWNGEPEPTPAVNLPMDSRAINHLIPLFRFLTPTNLHVYEFDWAPDSQSLAYIAANPPGENNWWVAKLYTQILTVSQSAAAPSYGSATRGGGDVGWEAKSTVILSPSDVPGPLHGLQIAVPRWSPDGKSIAFIGGLMSDQGVTGGDVWIVPSTGGQPRDLTPGRPTSAAWIAWDGDGHLYSSEIAGGSCQLVRLALQGDRTSESVAASFTPALSSFPGTVGGAHFDRGLSTTADRSLFVFAASNCDQPTEIFAAAPSFPVASGSPTEFPGLVQLSHFNDGIKPTWGPTVSLAWENDGFHIQGWLVLPANYDPAKKYPLIVEVHGGPASAVVPRWDVNFPFSPAVFSQLGYFILQPNPRGSYGQGEAFTQANRKDFGYGDLRDILAGVDTVIARYSVNPNRVGIDGWSYGGFMTMFALTQTHRFRVGVAGAGISDWLSYYGENSIDQWMIPYFGASVYDDPAVYAKSSAINYIKNVTTPTLLLVGDRDGECPAPQSFEYWHALRDLRVPTQLVVYPNEGHGLSDPAHRRDVLERAVDWFARYMPPGP